MLRKSTIPTLALVLLTFTLSQAYAADQSERLETLLERLADPADAEGEWVSEQVMELWAESGSRTTSYLYQRGLKAAREDNLAVAVEHFSAAIDHAPKFAQAYFSRGNMFLQQGEHGLAMEDFLRAVAFVPDHFEAYFGLGVTLEALGETKGALRAMRRSFALNPHREDLADYIERLEIEVEGRKT